MTSSVIVFGPTGDVGRAAAIEAHRRGAKVYLAMRDTNKALKEIQEKGNEDRYVRVQADLSKPETLKRVVEVSDAKTIFAYVPEDVENMRSSFEALKEAGVTCIVLLSSISVQDPLSSEVNLASRSSSMHSKAEIALQETGVPYVAVRPAYFSSNILWDREDIKKGEVELLCPNARLDYIVPSDIGTVCGALMAEPRLRQEAGQSLYLCGPDFLTQREAYDVIGKALGHEVKVKEIDEEAFIKKLGHHLPREVVEDMVHLQKENNAENSRFSVVHKEAAKNLRNYMEREPTKLGEWVAANKAAFA